jgi:hypothetical protein
VTTADVQLRLRPPLWAQVWVAVFPAVFVCFALFVVRPNEGPTWIGVLVALVFAPLLAWRLYRLAAIGSSDGRLVVRNHWRDRTIHRDDIAGVSVERRAGATNRSVALRLHDGSTLRLDVTETPFAGPFRRRLDRQADEVQEWVSGRPQPFL